MWLRRLAFLAATPSILDGLLFPRKVSTWRIPKQSPPPLRASPASSMDQHKEEGNGVSFKTFRAQQQRLEAAARKEAASLSGRLRGLVGGSPNVHWRAVTMDELREHPMFEALPALPPHVARTGVGIAADVEIAAAAAAAAAVSVVATEEAEEELLVGAATRNATFAKPLDSGDYLPNGGGSEGGGEVGEDVHKEGADSAADKAAAPASADEAAALLEQCSLVRQDSWQWAELSGKLHAGRLTPSKAAACLGLFEANEHTACLQVPRSLRGDRKKVLRAWGQLRRGHLSSKSGVGAVAGGRELATDRPRKKLQRETNSSDSVGGGGGGGGGDEDERRRSNSSGSTISSRRVRRSGGGSDDADGDGDKDDECAEKVQQQQQHIGDDGHVLWVPQKQIGDGGGDDESGSFGNRKHPFRFRPPPHPPPLPPTSSSSSFTVSSSSSVFKTPTNVRTEWGSAQEATSLLTVLNAVDAAVGNSTTFEDETNTPSPPPLSTLSAASPSSPSPCQPSSSPPSSPPSSSPLSYRFCEAGFLMLELVDAPPEVTALKRLKCRNSDNDGASLDRSGKASLSNDDCNASSKSRGGSSNLVESSAGAKGSSSSSSGGVESKVVQPVEQSCLSVGASPDGLIKFSNGSVVAVEVKNHSPFQELTSHKPPSRKSLRRRSGVKKKRKASQEQRDNPAMTFELDLVDGGPMPSIGAWLVPQLQLEMLCAGLSCRSALFCSSSATQGANLFLVPRDDAYIAEMMRLLVCFFDRYVETGTEPPPNFFLHHPPPPPPPTPLLQPQTPTPPSSSPPLLALLSDTLPALQLTTVTPCSPPSPPSYASFIARTASIASAAALWRHVPEGDTQRRHGGEGPKGSSSTAGRSSSSSSSSREEENIVGGHKAAEERGGCGGYNRKDGTPSSPLDSGIFL